MAETLAQRIKAKFPGEYDDVPDAELEARIDAKYPGAYTGVPRSAAAQAEPAGPAEPEGSAAGRFAAGAWQNLNPVNIAQGVYQAVRHPADTASAMLNAQMGQFSKAGEDISQGRYSEAVGHGLAGALPLIGPAAAQAGETIGQGDIAGGLGQGSALLATALVPAAVKGGLRAARAVPALEPAALEARAAANVADAMAPKIGANKPRFGRMADKVAPEVAKDLAREGASPWSREGLHAHVGDRLAQASDALDQAANARLQGQTFSARQIIDGLAKKRDSLTAQAAPGGGKSVVPPQVADHVKVINQAIKDVRQLAGKGDKVTFDGIKQLRTAADAQAKPIYSPAVTPDFMKVQGGAKGAADVAGVLRDHLAQWDPATAQANAQFSLWKTADDVLNATAEVERTRPKVGRQIAARVFGSVFGAQAGGAPGAAAGFVLGPIADAAVTSGVSPALRLAPIYSKLADAIRAGNTGQVYGLTERIKKLVAGATAANAVGRATASDPYRSPEPTQ